MCACGVQMKLAALDASRQGGYRETFLLTRTRKGFDLFLPRISHLQMVAPAE